MKVEHDFLNKFFFKNIYMRSLGGSEENLKSISRYKERYQLVMIMKSRLPTKRKRRKNSHR